ncbi:MAG: hypothetical protein B6D72_02770 [gamma proteobacterium symbiont of Ctena orbiculata]|uniref:Uncharacterized protein n=1 Tax=Candidatus Thiodiazotropha taylori TaxID=2792791 RepID=A0A944QSZ8_9GAMM|nr:hypothetical protein [Candidatus Thiodiazotropha taylori]PVV15047.1 MAG: hypothetical protein B6D72_02770 [gamma proteobacterium symbiont of Ctena orbiculata]MBT2989433.1 hypothetical protein [Candidatus Thiodiazotropha taylori]MBT2997013.1 hypothetical protein [Candidatus Thiodiazotropha taylori]MBT3000868.1 hypothetical protein [Candidatus Thiodiazotropha taylori]
MEKSFVRRLLCNRLSSVSLALNNLEASVSKDILQVLHRQVTAISRKYNEPVPVVSDYIVSSAAWGIAYCLLGPSKLLDVYPEFKDRTEEAEMELLLREGGETAENNIYQKIYTILLDSPHCHPEVRSLRNQARLAAVKPVQGLHGNHAVPFRR